MNGVMNLSLLISLKELITIVLPNKLMGDQGLDKRALMALNGLE